MDGVRRRVIYEKEDDCKVRPNINTEQLLWGPASDSPQSLQKSKARDSGTPNFATLTPNAYQNFVSSPR